jgi:hypothetical protein
MHIPDNLKRFLKTDTAKRDLTIAFLIKIIIIISLISWQKAQVKPRIEKRYSVLFSK